MYATPLLAAALAMAFVDAAPAPQDDGGVTNDSGTKTVTDGGFVHNIYSGKISKRSPNKRSLEKRVESDYVSSCGSTWVPVNDYQSGGRSWIGYESAVTAFCLHMTSDYDGNPTVIGPRTGTSDTISVDSSGNQIGLDGGKSVGIDASPGHIEFQIHNQAYVGNHIPTVDNCKFYSMNMTQSDASGSDCYGADNDDTKGGTWQVSNHLAGVSYHALAGKN